MSRTLNKVFCMVTIIPIVLAAALFSSLTFTEHPAYAKQFYADQIDPHIAVDKAGNAYALWVDGRNYNSKKPEIYFSLRPKDGQWGPNLRVNDGADFVVNCSLAVDGNGNAYALWLEGPGEHLFGVYFAYRPAGINSSWGPKQRVDKNDNVFYTWPAISVDENGNACAAWIRVVDEKYLEIQFAKRPAGPAGIWQGHRTVTDHSNTMPAQLALASACNLIGIVWIDIWGWDPNIYYTGSFFPFDNWSGKVKVAEGGKSAFPSLPTIGIESSDGNCGWHHAAWLRQKDEQEQYDIYYSRLKPFISSWEPQELINSVPGAADFSRPAIAVKKGLIGIVWDDYRGKINRIFSRYYLGGQWSGEFEVPVGISAKMDLSLAFDDGLNSYAVWANMNSSGPSYDIHHWDIFFSFQPLLSAWEPVKKVNDDLPWYEIYLPLLIK